MVLCMATPISSPTKYNTDIVPTTFTDYITLHKYSKSVPVMAETEKRINLGLVINLYNSEGHAPESSAK